MSRQSGNGFILQKHSELSRFEHFRFLKKKIGEKKKRKKIKNMRKKNFPENLQKLRENRKKYKEQFFMVSFTVWIGLDFLH